MGIFAAWAVDTLPIDTALRIKFEILDRGIGKPLGHLVVGMPVGGLVARVEDRSFISHSMFHRGVLPSVRMLELEICIGVELAISQSHAIVLPHITVTTQSGRILYQQALLGMFLGDNVHHSSYGVRTIKRRGSSFHDFYLLYIERVDE